MEIKANGRVFGWQHRERVQSGDGLREGPPREVQAAATVAASLKVGVIARDTGIHRCFEALTARRSGRAESASVPP